METIEQRVAATLRRKRAELRLSQAKTSELAGISERSYQRAEDKEEPTASLWLLERVAKFAFKCPLTSILQEPDQTQEDIGQVRSFLTTLTSLDDSQMSRYLAMMRAELKAARGEDDGDPSEGASEPGEGEGSGA